MEHIIPFNYDLNFDATNPENQIILWKIENYNSYLTDFSSNPKDKYIQFKYNLNGKDVIFTYYIEEKFFNVENLDNQQLASQLDPIYECVDITIYELLTKIETCIENMPEETEEGEEEEVEENLVYPKNVVTSYSNTQVKAGKLVTELNNKMGLSIFDTTIYDDFEKQDYIYKPEIKYTPLQEVDELITSDTLELSDNILSITSNNSTSEISSTKISEYVGKLESEYTNVNVENDLSDIFISTIQTNTENGESFLSGLQPSVHLTKEDPYSSLVLSDSDFLTFYENLNVATSSNALDEKQILNTCLQILKSETPITDEQMKKYAFNETSIIKMLIKEVMKANSNEKISIKISNNNIFVLNVCLKKENWTNPVLNGLDVELEVIFPKLYYPYAPPKINIISPKFTDIFLFSVESLDYLKQEFWNPSNTLIYTLLGLVQIINQYGEIDTANLNVNTNINNEVIQLWSELDIKSSVIDFKIDFTKLSSDNISNGKQALAAGTGYGNESCNKWDIKKFISERKNKTGQIINLLQNIVDKINIEKLTPDFVQVKLNSILHYYLYDVNVLEITNKLAEYTLIIKILQIIKSTIGTFGELEKLVLQVRSTVGEYVKIASFDKEIFELYDQILKLTPDLEPIVQEQNTQNKILTSYNDLQSMQFENIPINNFTSKIKLETLTGDSRRRIMRELSSLQKSLPFNYETSVFFRFDESQMNKIKFLITGPKDTPYQDGCYIFDMVLPSTYPKSCPKVEFMTTGKGSVRFNPNLYSCGKVCLSLLGTWSGRPEEAWNENSTMLQLFVSIQSLILIDHPYFNEPGYQSSYGSPSGMAASAKYNGEVKLNNIKWAIIDTINNPDPCFADVIKAHFAFKKDQILNMALEWSKTSPSIAAQLDTLKAVLAKV